MSSTHRHSRIFVLDLSDLRSTTLRLLDLGCLLLTSEGVCLGGLSFDSPLTGSLDLGTSLVHLILEGLLTLLLSLGLVDVFDESSLVLEGVTLRLLVQLVVEVLV